MIFSHILITRPQQEALELADMLAPMLAEIPTRTKIIILPAHTFLPVKLLPDQLGQLLAASARPEPMLLIFTSPRAVEFGLGQIPPEVVRGARVAAIGPSTSALLEQAGIAVSIRPRQGYTSEDLIRELALTSPVNQPKGTVAAFILAAPGGRTLIKESLQAIGYTVHTLIVYQSQPAELDVAAVSRIERAIEQAGLILVLWTSANAMTALSERLPAHCWRKLCEGEWLVISDRLAQLARSSNPARIHTTRGPANEEIAAAVQALIASQQKAPLPSLQDN